MNGNGDIPKEVYHGTIKVDDLELIVSHLDNGKRFISQEEMIKFIDWLRTDPPVESVKKLIEKIDVVIGNEKGDMV